MGVVITKAVHLRDPDNLLIRHHKSQALSRACAAARSVRISVANKRPARRLEMAEDSGQYGSRELSSPVQYKSIELSSPAQYKLREISSVQCKSRKISSPVQYESKDISLTVQYKSE